MENEYLIVGLGNPGREYERTRHNAGFMVAERLAGLWKANWSMEKKFSARIAKADLGGNRLWLCEPQTYMNLSGESVGALVGFRKFALERVMVVVDDADLPLGEVRLRSSGSSGGHHGLESVEQHLGTREYTRQRIGIGRRDQAVREIAGHVLSQFSAGEQEVLEKVLQRACDQVESWLKFGVAKAMSQFNGAVKI
ncbi:MAG: aminoacyl-tRNA hydrolase [Verrucomicrobia bacterium]|nr:aminoacyl-tRNA hydrolase [Verrucomicrobiota bacterium]